MRELRLGRAKIEGRVPCLLGLGFLAGAVNGLLGAGGGILVVWAIGYALRGEEYDERDFFANALCVMLPISVLSCVRYVMRGHLSLDAISGYALPALAGGLLGGLLLGKIKVGVLKKLFAALVIYSGLVLILR